MKRSPSRGSQESGPSPPGKKDSELEVILRRRRNKAGEAGSGGNHKLTAHFRLIVQIVQLIYSKTNILTVKLQQS